MWLWTEGTVPEVPNKTGRSVWTLPYDWCRGCPCGVSSYCSSSPWLTPVIQAAAAWPRNSSWASLASNWKGFAVRCTLVLGTAAAIATNTRQWVPYTQWHLECPLSAIRCSYSASRVFGVETAQANTAGVVRSLSKAQWISTSLLTSTYTVTVQSICASTKRRSHCSLACARESLKRHIPWTTTPPNLWLHRLSGGIFEWSSNGVSCETWEPSRYPAPLSSYSIYFMIIKIHIY